MAVTSQDWRKANVRMLLSLYFGWAGADRFYNGQILLGVLKAVTGGALFVWWLVDIFYFSYLAGKAEPGKGYWWRHIRLALSVVYGFFGVDRAFNGQVGWAILKLVTVGGLGVWWIADAAYYAYLAGQE